MENKTLAIRGHSTRGNEVIKILEMLGGKNKFNFKGNEDKWLVLNGNIQRSDTLFDEKGFTLEEFLEKYPYKVGNMVKYKGSTSWRFIYKIKKMIWKDNQINYIVYNPWQENNKCTFTAEDLQPYKEAIYTDYAIDDDSKTNITIDGEKLIAPNGYTVKNATTNGNSLIVEYVKNKPQYPKTYDECCQITEKVAKTTHELDIAYNPNLIYDFQKLLICRDAYWKIAGEEMRLSEPWKPDLTDVKQNKYTITNVCNKIQFELYGNYNGVLAFPTEEMRDAFFENFKDLIEKCKEFL